MDKMRETKGIQERFLSELCRDKTFVHVYLTNKIRLEGTIQSFDTDVVYMEESTQQIVYKSAICSIVV